MSDDDRLSDLMARAREHEPFDTERAGLGLETRVLAQMNGLRRNGEAGFIDDLGKWVWRSALGVAPVVALLVLWLCLWSGFSVEILSYDAVGGLTAYLPID